MPKSIKTEWGVESEDLEEERLAIKGITISEKERLNFSRKLFTLI